MKASKCVSESSGPTALGERRYLTKVQLAGLLQVCPRQIEKWMAGRKIPYRKLGRRCIRFDVNAVEQALACYEVKAVVVEGGANERCRCS